MPVGVKNAALAAIFRDRMGDDDPLAQLFLGVPNTDQLYSQGREEYPELAKLPGSDKPAHAMGSQRITERLGPTAASLLGQGREVYTGVQNMFKGGEFFDEDRGYSHGDIAANRMGISRGQRPRVTKRVKDRVREIIREEMADPTTGEPIGKMVKIPNSMIRDRLRSWGS